MLDKDRERVPGCDTYTRPEEIAQLSKFLKKVHKVQDDHAELDDYNIAVHGAFSGMIPNIDKLEDYREPLEDNTDVGLDDTLISLDDVNEVSLGNTRVNLDDDTKVSLSEDLLKLDVEKDTNLSETRENLVIDEVIGLPNDAIGLEDKSEIERLDGRASTLETSIDEIVDLPNEVVTLDKPTKNTNLGKDRDRLKNVEIQDVHYLKKDLLKIDPSDVSELDDDLSKLETTDINKIESQLDKLTLPKDELELDNNKEDLKVTDIKKLDTTRDDLKVKDKIDLSKGKEELYVFDDTELSNDKEKLSVSDVKSLSNELEQKPEDRQDSEFETEQLIDEASNNSEFLDFLDVKIKGLKELTGDDLYNGVLELLSDERFGEWGEKMSSYLSSFANRYSEKISTNKNSYLPEDINDISRFKEVLQNSLVYSPVPSDINTEIAERLKTFLEDENLVNNRAELPSAVEDIIIELYKKTQSIGISETAREAVDEVISNKLESSYREDLIGSENTEYLIDELATSLEEMLKESTTDSVISELSNYREGLVEDSSQNSEKELASSTSSSKLATLLNKYTSKAVSYSNTVISKILGGTQLATSAKTMLSNSVLSTIITARDSIEKNAGLSLSSLPGTALTAGNSIAALKDENTASGLKDSLAGVAQASLNSEVKNPINRPDGTGVTHFWSENGRKETPANTDNVTNRIEEFLKDVKDKGLTDTDKIAKQSLGSSIYTFSENYLSGLGISTTLSGLCNTLPSQVGSVEELNNLLLDSQYISSPKKYTSSKKNGFRAFTLDSNSHWELILEPFTGKSNGYYSFLPAIQEINIINSLLHGVNTGYCKWVPVNSFELQKSKLKTKSTMLAEGEIYYPTGIDMFNEFRVTIVDDQYKSWRSYFEKCMEVSIYNSETHDYQYYRDMSKFKFSDVWKLDGNSALSTESNLLNEYTNEEEVGGPTSISGTYNTTAAGEENGKLKFNSKVLKSQKVKVTNTKVVSTKTNANVKRSRVELGGVGSVGITAVDKTHILVPNFKNITFKCTIFITTPQLSTIKKYVLLLVLKDFTEEYNGEVDSSAGDLTLSFSIVGENPHDDEEPGMNRWSKTQNLGEDISTTNRVYTKTKITEDNIETYKDKPQVVETSTKKSTKKRQTGKTTKVTGKKEVEQKSDNRPWYYYYKLRTVDGKAINERAIKTNSGSVVRPDSTGIPTVGGTFWIYKPGTSVLKEDTLFQSDLLVDVSNVLENEKYFKEVYKNVSLSDKNTIESKAKYGRVNTGGVKFIGEQLAVYGLANFKQTSYYKGLVQRQKAANEKEIEKENAFTVLYGRYEVNGKLKNNFYDNGIRYTSPHGDPEGMVYWIGVENKASRKATYYRRLATKGTKGEPKGNWGPIYDRDNLYFKTQNQGVVSADSLKNINKNGEKFYKDGKYYDVGVSGTSATKYVYINNKWVTYSSVSKTGKLISGNEYNKETVAKKNNSPLYVRLTKDSKNTYRAVYYSKGKQYYCYIPSGSKMAMFSLGNSTSKFVTLDQLKKSVSSFYWIVDKTGNKTQVK